MAHIMGIAGYDVVGIGEGELRYGLGFLRAQIAAESLPAVSANLVYEDSGKPIVEPFRVLRRGGLRVGVTAITGDLEDLKDKEPVVEWAQQTVTLLDPKTRLAEVVQRMRKKEKVDVVIVMSHLGEEVGAKMAQEIPGIDVWIEAHNRGRLVQPEKKAGTIFTACRGRSSAYADLYLSLGPEKAITGFEGQARTLPSQGPTDQTVAALIAEFKQADKKPAPPLTQTGKRPRFDTTAVGKDTYLGAQSCRECHLKIYDSWLQTPHAAAFSTLAEGDSETNLDCLLCHTTGYGQMSDPQSGTIDPKFWNVQCESCHGKGTDHDKSPGRATVAEYVCRECHNQSNSPEFEYEVYLRRVAH